MEHPLGFLLVDVTNMQSFMDKLNNSQFPTSTNNIKRQKKKSYFRSVWYGEDIIMGLDCF